MSSHVSQKSETWFVTDLLDACLQGLSQDPGRQTGSARFVTDPAARPLGLVSCVVMACDGCSASGSWGD